MTTYIRTNKLTGDTTELDFDRAVINFIKDNYDYAVADGTIDPDEESLEDMLGDMMTVFDAEAMIRDIAKDGLDAGVAIYKVK